MTQFDKRNISMMMDLYEMTMANGYFLQEKGKQRAVFEVFYRKNPDKGAFSIFAGLQQIIEYIENLHFTTEDIEFLRSLHTFHDGFLDYLRNFRFTGDIYAFREGTIIYPGEPFITVVAPIVEAQIIETYLLTQVNHQSLIATKTNRIVRAAAGRPVSDMGARRAHNVDAAVLGARAAYIGGVQNTATVLAGQLFHIPLVGTMAHSWVMAYDSEYEAFCRYADIYQEASVLLVDTYDTLQSGVPNAIKVAKEILIPNGKRLKGIRIDSGDMIYLSKKARTMLDNSGLKDCKIIASNSLDEHSITKMIENNACTDSFGVGERLITSYSDATFGAVYKLVALEEDGKFVPKIKLSEDVQKATNPGFKKVYRIYNKNGKAMYDLLTGTEEKITKEGFTFISPNNPDKQELYTNFSFRELLQPVFLNGKFIAEQQNLNDIREFVNLQLNNEIQEDELKLENALSHSIVMSTKYYKQKLNLMQNTKE